jgi:hypothetical protein
MGSTFCLRDVTAIIYREEDVRCFGEVRKGFAECAGIGCLEDHEGHARAEEDDVGVFVSGEEFVFKVPGVDYQRWD